jgi:hypothetical protein
MAKDLKAMEKSAVKLLLASFLAAMVPVPAMAQCVDTVIIYLDRSGSMLPQNAADMSKPSPYRDAIDAILRFKDTNDIGRSSDITVYPFDTLIGDPVNRHSSEELRQGLLAAGNKTPANGTDLTVVMDRIAEGHEPSLGSLIVIVSDFVQDIRSAATYGDEERAWSRYATVPLAALEKHFIKHQRTSLLLVHPDRHGSRNDISERVIGSIVAKVRRSRELTMKEVGPTAAALATLFGLRVERGRGKFLLHVDDLHCGEIKKLNGFRFNGDYKVNDLVPAKGFNACGANSLPAAITDHALTCAVDDQRLDFTPPTSGVVYALTEDGSEVSLPAQFQLGISLDVQSVRIRADSKTLSVTINASGQLIDSTSMYIVLNDDGKEIPIEPKDWAGVQLNAIKPISFSVPREGNLASLEVGEVGVRVVAKSASESIGHDRTLRRVPTGHPEGSEHDFAEHLLAPIVLAMLLIWAVVYPLKVIGLRFFEEVLAVTTVAVGAIVAVLQEATSLWASVEHVAAHHSTWVVYLCVIVTGVVFVMVARKGLFAADPPVSFRRRKFEWCATMAVPRKDYRGASIAISIIFALMICIIALYHCYSKPIGECTFETENFVEVPVAGS